VVIALEQPSQSLWHQTRRDHRRDINKLKRTGFTASITNTDLDLETFRAIYKATMRRVGASQTYFFSQGYFEDLTRAMAGRLFLCTVKLAERVAAAGLFTEVSGIVQFHLSGTADDFVSWHPSKLMLHFVREWARDRGNQFFHLGGGTGGPRDTLLDFKSGFSNEILPFYTWDIIADEKAYAALVGHNLNGSDPPGVNGSDYFPLYRAPAKHADPARNGERHLESAGGQLAVTRSEPSIEAASGHGCGREHGPDVGSEPATIFRVNQQHPITAGTHHD
jgi:hypothetical protein